MGPIKFASIEATFQKIAAVENVKTISVCNCWIEKAGKAEEHHKGAEKSEFK